jgi:hypothetical protein
MYLMSALRYRDDWNFLVQGASSSLYYVHMSPERWQCECPDFTRRGDCCKHIFFIVGRVLGDRELMEDIEVGLSAAELFSPAVAFTERLEIRLSARLAADTPDSDEFAASTGGGGAAGVGTGPGADCVICFEALGVNAWVCDSGCKQRAMHTGCAARWLKKKSSCPLCRAPARFGAPGAPDDVLANFKSYYNSTPT